MDICRKEGTIDECQRKLAFRKYKEKCKEIADNTVSIMAAAREKATKKEQEE